MGKGKAVFILGAGASAPFNVPTLMGLFLEYHARIHLKKDTFLNDKLHEIFWKPRGYDLDTSNQCLSVEEILTLIRDHENEIYGVPPLLPQEETERFRRSLYVLIKKAIYDGKNSRGKYLNPLISYARKTFEEIVWASFNWDCIFEASYYYSSGDYAITRSNPNVVIKLDNWRKCSSSNYFLKLHGGVNWWYDDKKLVYLPFGYQPDLDTRWNNFENNKTTGLPVILEPSYYKYDDPVYELLKPQWDFFVKKLIEADIVVILGYSLPEADIESRRALSIGFQCNDNSKFLVIDKDDWVCKRYTRLFGCKWLTCIKADLKDIYGELPNIIETNIHS